MAEGAAALSPCKTATYKNHKVKSYIPSALPITIFRRTHLKTKLVAKQFSGKPVTNKKGRTVTSSYNFSCLVTMPLPPSSLSPSSVPTPAPATMRVPCRTNNSDNLIIS